MQGRLKTGQGSVSISSEVIAQYAGTSALECFGIVGMATVSMTDGLVKLLRGSSLTKGAKTGDFAAVTAKAQEFVKAVEAARA